jgi:hypothetical protein
MSEKELENDTMITDTEELRKIFYDALSIGPMFRPLEKLLEDKIEEHSGRVRCKDVLKVLNSN